MRYTFLAVALFAACTACSKVQDTTSNVLDTVGDKTSSAWDQMRDLIDVPSTRDKNKTKAQPRYCYQTYEDVICYSKPLAGDQDRMTGYQEPSGKTGYTMSPPHLANNFGPPKAELPTPQTKPPAAPPAATDKKQLKEVIFDPAELEPKTLVPDKPE